MIRHYLVELTTEIGVVINDNEVTDEVSAFQLITDKTKEIMGVLDFNDREYQIKVIGEGKSE